MHWKGTQVAYGTRLESVHGCKVIRGSNPLPSAVVSRFYPTRLLSTNGLIWLAKLPLNEDFSVQQPGDGHRRCYWIEEVDKKANKYIDP